MIRPRPYQVELFEAGCRYLNERSGNGLIVSPTGTGKSLTNSMLLKWASQTYPGIRSMVVTDDRKIVSQNCQSLYNYWPETEAGIYSAGLQQRNTHSSIIFGGIQSIHRKAHDFGHRDLLIVDEAHMLGPRDESMYGRFIAGLRKTNPNIRLLGTSATPFRLGMGLLTEGDMFDDIIIDFSKTEKFCWFIDQGYLAPLVTKRPSTHIDLTGVPVRMGEYNEKLMEEIADRSDTNRSVVEEVIEQGRTRNHWMGFCSGVGHAEHLKTMFLACGVSAEVVHGKMSETEQDRIEALFRAGQIRCILNCNVYNKGWDFDALDLIFVARGTQSCAWWIQVLGRGTRPLFAPGFDLETTDGRLASILASAKANGCLVLDFCRNTEKLGPVNDPVLPSPKKKGVASNSGDAPVKACHSCGAYNHTRASECVTCGEPFPPSSCIEPTASTNELVVRKASVPILQTLHPLRQFFSKKMGSNPARGEYVRVAYEDLSTTVSEYYFPSAPESESYMIREFSKFWFTAGGKKPLPASADEVLARAKDELTKPVEVTYHKNSRHSDVVSKRYT